MVIGKKFSAKEVGLFTRGSQFPSMANSTLVSTFNRVAYPVLSQLQDDDEQLLHFYEKYIQVFCFIAFPVLMLICGCARPLVSLLLTDKWIECVPLMQIICFSLLPNGLIQINLNLLYVKGRSDLVLRMEIIKKLIMFGVLFLSIFFGLKGICAGMVVNALIDLYFSSYYTKKILSYGLGRQLRAVAPYFLISLVILAESLLVSHFFSSNWLSLLIAAVVTSLSFWSVSKATNLYAYRETLSLVEEKLLKKA